MKKKINDSMKLTFKNNSIEVPFVETFGEVEKGKELIMKDDYGRVEVALNMDSFLKRKSPKIPIA